MVVFRVCLCICVFLCTLHTISADYYHLNKEKVNSILEKHKPMVEQCREEYDDSLLKVVVVHHKTGTVLMYRVARLISAALGLQWTAASTKPSLELDKISDDIDYKFYNAWVWPELGPSDVIPQNRTYRILHMIRDPVEILASAYLYHKHSSERWLKRPIVQMFEPDQVSWLQHDNIPLKELKEMTYQEAINLLPLDQGVRLEFERSKPTLFEIVDLHKNLLDDKNSLTMRLKYVMENFNESFEKIFNHMEFPESCIPLLMDLAKLQDVSQWSQPDVHMSNSEDKESVRKVLMSYADIWALLDDFRARLGIERDITNAF